MTRQNGPARRAVLAGAAAAVLLPGAVRAQAWPSRTITLVIPFAPGGGTDTFARPFAAKLSQELGQQVVIDNRAGAGGTVGAAIVAKAKPDGYTFLVGAVGVVTNGFLHAKMPYADSDLVPVGMIAVAPSVIVIQPGIPANNMKEFVAWAKAQGAAGVTFATAGSGSTPHFVSEMLKEATGINFVIVPYKSGSEGMVAVMSNNVAGTSEASIVTLPQVKAGKLKAIATTYQTRISAYPSIPTTAEEGFPTVQIGHWAGLFAPKGTPPAIIEKLNNALQAALKTKEVRDQLIPNGIEPAGGTTAQFVRFFEGEKERLGKVAKAAKMTAE